MAHPLNILERYWNYTSFRPLQEEIINAVLDNHDTFVLLPTGGGKSICFHIPALIKEGICIVISPLVALMKDQVSQLNQKGIKAIALTSGISYKELDTLLDNCIYGNYKFLYLSPERLQQPIVKQRIEQMNVNLIAVDEAHCISQWGHDFRPAYSNIKVLRTLHPSVNCIALTASATLKVIDDTISSLEFIDTKTFKASYNRDNIAYQIFNTEDKLYELKRLLDKHQGASIIYVRSRKKTVEIHEYLEKQGVSSTFFHGGIATEEKQRRFELWMTNQKPIMVATTAFGMGIDKPDVKTVFHLDLPESIESYFQETGRAGRNGNDAFAITLTNNSDEQRLKNQFISSLPDLDFLKTVYRKLCNYFQISYGEGEQTTHQFEFNQFCNTYGFSAVQTFNALNILDRNSIIKLSQQFNYKSKLQFIVPNNVLFAYLEKNSNFDLLVKSILRTYGGIFEHQLAINIGLISDKTGIKEQAIIKDLNKLHKDGIVDFFSTNTDSEIVMIEPREDDITINRISKTVEQQQEIKKKQVKSVIHYMSNTTECKSRLLLKYFGEETSDKCGICSYCTENDSREVEMETIIKEIISSLSKEPLSSRQLTERLLYRDSDVLLGLKILLEQNKIETTTSNTYSII